MTLKKIILSVCVLLISTVMLSGCTVHNPIRYMREADEKYLADSNDKEDNENESDSHSDSKKGVAIIDAFGMKETKDMIRLSSKVKSQLDEKETTAVVIMLDRSVIYDFAFFVHITNDAKKPVIAVTREEDSDTACRITTSPEVKGKGVLIYIGEDIISAENGACYRVSLDSTGTASFDDEFAAYKPDRKTVIDISGINDLPYVEIVYDYSGNDGTFVEKMLNLSEGLVVVTDTYDGSVSEGAAMILKGVSKSLPVVKLSTNTLGDDKENESEFIKAGSLSPARTRILLSAGMTMTKDYTKLQNIFDEYQ